MRVRQFVPTLAEPSGERAAEGRARRACLKFGVVAKSDRKELDGVNKQSVDHDLGSIGGLW